METARYQDHTPVHRILDHWASAPLSRHFCCHRIFTPSPPKTAPYPAWVADPLIQALRQRGINELYTHQRSCSDAVHDGEDVVVATPTASGKTLCYNLPVFSELLLDPGARALYLFPTKALARDQVEEARKLASATGRSIGVAVYDGDTPPADRRAARRQARILATNPDMLHVAILPHHPSWAELLGGLRFIVLDELHTYRGVFGSHLAHVLRRLLRVARFYGARPQLVTTSATIANPGELAGQLLGRPVRLVSDSGAPTGERHLMIYNPPLVDAPLGLREGVIKSACRLTMDLVSREVGTLVFCRSRLAVEVMVRELKELLGHDGGDRAHRIRGYRGGYLPGRRREVEHALRRGETDIVVATSALELGIDIGGLDAVVMVGWPGSRAAAWQRAGRAGRRFAPSLAVLLTSSEPLDQFVALDPEYLLGQAPEHARINPDNPSILVPHLKCAAAELPFAQGEAYGSYDAQKTEAVLSCLAEAGLLHHGPRGFHYTGHPQPAAEVRLRGHLDDNFLVVQQPEGRVIAEVDYNDAPQVLHDEAIYQLEGRQYQVLRLDHDNRKAYVSEVQVDYYTDARTQTRVRILERTEERGAASLGEVHVVHRVLGFKKIKIHTRENVGYGEVHQPEREMHTTAFWLALPRGPVARLERTPAEIAAAAVAAAHALHSAAALLLMSERRDLGLAVGDTREAGGWFTGGGAYLAHDNGSDLIGPSAPTIFLFDRFPGGTGLGDRLFSERHALLSRGRQMVSRCACRDGCPACVGPGNGHGVRELSIELLTLFEAHLSPGRLESSRSAG